MIRDERRRDARAKQVHHLWVLRVHAVRGLDSRLRDHLVVLQRLHHLETERLVAHLPEHARAGLHELPEDECLPQGAVGAIDDEVKRVDAVVEDRAVLHRDHGGDGGTHDLLRHQAVLALRVVRHLLEHVVEPPLAHRAEQDRLDVMALPCRVLRQQALDDGKGFVREAVEAARGDDDGEVAEARARDGVFDRVRPDDVVLHREHLRDVLFQVGGHLNRGRACDLVQHVC
mmetsp:Transcript_9786/g.30201  ORF Transcript_9786/g.30201 Transcript_9786/m.30201 type:complete len:230 (+) Transcript_9786:432-1121(+)